MSSLTRLHRAAEEIVGLVDWDSDWVGTCRCPAEEKHTKNSSERDCRVYLQGTPHLYCLHTSCLELLEQIVTKFRRELDRPEFVELRAAWPRSVRTAPRERWTNYEPEMLGRLARRVPPISSQWLMDRSPIPVQKLTPDDFLAQLYRPSEKVLVFVGNQASQGIIWDRDRYPNPRFRPSHANGVWFQNQPVDGQFRKRPIGGPSRRGSASVSAWRYVVLESDVADEEPWLAALVQLPLPIAAIYSSGGRSVHALLKNPSDTKEGLDRLLSEWKPLLVRLGADRQSLSTVRNTRLAQAYRGARQQQLYFLSPNPSSGPLWKGERS